MPGAHMTAAELADEIGRSGPWITRHWRSLVKSHNLPAPISDPAGGLAWNRAQVYAWLDKDLTPAQQRVAAAFRAAYHAAGDAHLSHRADLEIAASEARIAQALGRSAQ